MRLDWNDDVQDSLYDKDGNCTECGTLEGDPHAVYCGTPVQRLTRYERLQMAADAGYDTWEEYRDYN